jgi:hypothetical protein
VDKIVPFISMGRPHVLRKLKQRKDEISLKGSERKPSAKLSMA